MLQDYRLPPQRWRYKDWHLIVVVTIDANDVIGPPRIEVLPVNGVVVPIPDLGLAAFFTSGGEMNTICRVLR